MDFRTALKSLYLAGEVNAREFVDYVTSAGVMKRMSVKNASHCLSRLFKMRLAHRKKDRRSGKKQGKTPYLYRISDQGIRYLKWLKRQKENYEIEIPKTLTEQISELEQQLSDLKMKLYSNS
jgi:signal-transduction protein with cAMP-binding, CBS, and nucleotidyltransferase domain